MTDTKTPLHIKLITLGLVVWAASLLIPGVSELVSAFNSIAH